MSLSVLIQPATATSHRVAIAGHLDARTAPDLGRELAPLLATSAKPLVLDLSGLEAASPEGAGAILEARDTLEGRGGHLLLVGLQPQVQQAIDALEAMPVIEIFVSLAEADAFLDALRNKALRGDDED